jgi:hypothetical protein
MMFDTVLPYLAVASGVLGLAAGIVSITYWCLSSPIEAVSEPAEMDHQDGMAGSYASVNSDVPASRLHSVVPNRILYRNPFKAKATLWLLLAVSLSILSTVLDAIGPAREVAPLPQPF